MFQELVKWRDQGSTGEILFTGWFIKKGKAAWDGYRRRFFVLTGDQVCMCSLAKHFRVDQCAGVYSPFLILGVDERPGVHVLFIFRKKYNGVERILRCCFLPLFCFFVLMEYACSIAKHFRVSFVPLCYRISLGVGTI